LGLLAAATGCRNCDLVEAQLRTCERELREAREELAQAECHNEALLRELHGLRCSQAAKLTPELASQTYTLRQIALGRLTGGHDSDDCPGDEALQVVLEPRDADGHAVKAPGAVHVEALQITPEGLKMPLDSWDLSPEQVRRSWRSGFLSTGYTLTLPWKSWPTSDRLRVVARLTLADGRTFEAERDVSVRLTPAARQRTSPPLLLEEAPRPPPPPPKAEPIGPPVEPASWRKPGDAVQPAGLWRAPQQQAPLLDSVRLLRPVPLPPAPAPPPLEP
jgi:hypothetical protein